MGGFPTIKHGDPSDLQDYQGGRDFDSLKKFAEENLGPQCGPSNLDLCDDKKRKKLEGYMAMSLERVEAKNHEFDQNNGRGGSAHEEGRWIPQNQERRALN